MMKERKGSAERDDERRRCSPLAADEGVAMGTGRGSDEMMGRRGCLEWMAWIGTASRDGSRAKPHDEAFLRALESATLCHGRSAPPHKHLTPSSPPRSRSPAVECLVRAVRQFACEASSRMLAGFQYKAAATSNSISWLFAGLFHQSWHGYLCAAEEPLNPHWKLPALDYWGRSDDLEIVPGIGRLPVLQLLLLVQTRARR